MKTTLIVMALSFSFLKGFGQVGINTTSPEAQLDIRSSNQALPSNTDGVLIPKIDDFPVVNPTAAQQGMLVYLTPVLGLNPAGFYYWDDITTSWISLGGSTTNWSILGNSGTNPATHFIGT
ncbi:MAG: hypothetical protein IPP30_09270 [Flavobacterium sp.]|nr:hypothetical protein [Flavobacterium sp.]